eukprot:TRINITY_DN112460_c0_g1_i1.p1 TRINITY_DN112460_c0_g1~~TRINITY_DN112460_c0_g1_i1.p1  ORF type:complete len:365 (+),score=98.82 TRINITY_DN112460_c0_g1_i1:72-1166(+)
MAEISPQASADGDGEGHFIPAGGGSEEAEELLENDLYLLNVQHEDPDALLSACEPAEVLTEASLPRRRPCGSRRRTARHPELPVEETPLALKDQDTHPAGAEADPPPQQEGEANETQAEPEEPSLKRKKFESKPVECRQEGDEDSPWITFPSLAACSRETGVPCGSIGNLCTHQDSHSGWTFRWPGAAPIPHPVPSERQEALPPEELDAILHRLRAVPPAERRAALASMPEVTRRHLLAHLKQEADGPRLRSLLADLPRLLEVAGPKKGAQLMEGVKQLEMRTAEVLAAPDVASMVRILREEVTPEQRHAIVESLSSETQEAVIAHLRAEKAAAGAITRSVEKARGDRQGAEYRFNPGLYRLAS